MSSLPARLRTTRAGAIAFASLGMAGVLPQCSLPPRPLSWTIELDTPSLLARAAVVHTEIRAGGCGGTARYASDVRPGERAEVPPALAAGRWGFAADAINASCVRFAGDCDELVLPGPTSVSSLLRGFPDVPACDASECSSGACVRPDAGTDAPVPPGTDAPVPPGTDAGPDAPRLWPDAGPRDPGPALAPALPCESPMGAAILPYLEILAGTVTTPGSPADLIQLAAGTTIRVHFSHRSEFSPFTFLHVGNGSFDVAGCGFSYSCDSPTSGGDGFESLPNGRCTSSSAAVPTAGECTVTITARGGPVAFRRLDATCRSATALPTVTLALDGMAMLTRPAPASALLTWSTTQAVSCVADLGTGWAGPQPASGSLAVTDLLPATHEFRLVCDGPVGGTGMGTATFVVTP